MEEERSKTQFATGCEAKFHRFRPFRLDCESVDRRILGPVSATASRLEERPNSPGSIGRINLLEASSFFLRPQVLQLVSSRSVRKLISLVRKERFKAHPHPLTYDQHRRQQHQRHHLPCFTCRVISVANLKAIHLPNSRTDAHTQHFAHQTPSDL